MRRALPAHNWGSTLPVVVVTVPKLLGSELWTTKFSAQATEKSVIHISLKLDGLVAVR